MDIIQHIKEKIIAGTVIPKPKAKTEFIVKGWGKRRGYDALIYFVPNHKDPSKPYEKGVNVEEWRLAYKMVNSYESFTRDWFNQNMSECAEEGDCNFTTIGGIFQLLGLVDYARGVYTPR